MALQEFAKLKWRITEPSELEQQTCFLTEEAVSDLYVYKNFIRPIKNQPSKQIKLHVPNDQCVPGEKYYRFIPKRSILTKKLKEQCLQAMKLIHSGKTPESMTAYEKTCLNVYSNCQPQIADENRAFLEFIQNIWNRNANIPLRIKPAIQGFSWFHWKQMIKKYIDYPQFYKQHSSLKFTYNENDVQYQHLQNVAEYGTVARFTQISNNVAFTLKIITLPVEEDKENPARLPVSHDSNIPPLLKQHPVDVVISSSALKQLSDCTDTKSKWFIPVKVEEIECNGKMKKVVFIDKVLPKPNPSYHDLKVYAYKRLVKTNLCQYEAFSFDEGKEETESDEETAEKEVDEAEKSQESGATKKNKKARTRKIHHNVSYRVWDVRKTNANTLMKNTTKDCEIKLMVRCKLDACEMNEQGLLQPIVIRPKLEQQLQYGVNIPSKSELAREWTALFFHPYTNLYRVRIFPPQSEVIAVEKCSLQKINTEAFTHHHFKPILSLGVLQSIFQELLTLDCGYYLVQHSPKNEGFLSVLQQADEEQSTFDLYSEYDNVQVDTETRLNWLPIDVNYILPVHEKTGQLPATFRGFDTNSSNKGSKNKNKKKKKNTANSTKGQRTEDEGNEWEDLLIP